MEAVSCDNEARNPLRTRGVSKALFIASILHRETHNNRAFRTGSELLAGKRACEWRAGDLAARGHVEMLRIRLARLKAESKSESISEEECNSADADEAARHI
jgi:hypothetical protein